MRKMGGGQGIKLVGKMGKWQHVENFKEGKQRQKQARNYSRDRIRFSWGGEGSGVLWG